MRTTQIGYTTLSESSLRMIQRELTQNHVKVTHPLDGIVVSRGQWDNYEQQVALYQAIADSSFHLIANEDGKITAKLALQMLYAMVKSRPLVLLATPQFSPDVDQFARQIINAHLPAIAVARLAPGQLAACIDTLPETLDYELDSSHKILIRARVKSYFRTLVREAQAAEVSRADR